MSLFIGGDLLGIYKHRKIQLTLMLLYPLIVLCLMIISPYLNSWIIPASIALLYCCLWGDLRYLFMSNLLMWLISVAVWFFLILQTNEGKEHFIAHLAIICVEFVFVALLPQMLFVSVRNSIIEKKNRKLQEMSNKKANQ